MTARTKLCCQFILFVTLLLSIPATALADDSFSKIVKNIESHYGAKKKKIPMLGLAGFFVKIVRPAGVKDFKFALFEDQDFLPRPSDANFETALRRSLDKKWQPMARANSRALGNRSYIYTHQSGKDIEILSVTFTARQAVVAQAKVNPDALAKFMENPEIFGINLGKSGGSSNIGGSLFGGFSSMLSGKTIDNYHGDSSIATLRSADAPTSTADKAPPTLGRRTGQAEDEYNPVSDLRAANATGSAVIPTEAADIKLEARLVNLNVKATDKNGNPLSTLNKEDFRVFEDGVEQAVFYFEPVNAPINLVLLLDLSGSTHDKRKVMQEAAKKFIDSLAPTDRIALAAFTREFVLLSDFTTDRKQLKKSLEKIKKIEGGTAFYDAMWETFDLLRRNGDARQAIVVLTDGEDNSLMRGSQFEETEHTFEEVLARAAEEDATIYPIYLKMKAEDEQRWQQLLLNAEISEGRRERLTRLLKVPEMARAQLDELAEQTAGTVFKARNADDLDGVYQKVASELRLLYTLAYTPKGSQRDGKYRRINVQLKREGANAKTRRGYYDK